MTAATWAVRTYTQNRARIQACRGSVWLMAPLLQSFKAMERNRNVCVSIALCFLLNAYGAFLAPRLMLPECTWNSSQDLSVSFKRGNTPTAVRESLPMLWRFLLALDRKAILGFSTLLCPSLKLDQKSPLDSKTPSFCTRLLKQKGRAPPKAGRCVHLIPQASARGLASGNTDIQDGQVRFVLVNGMTNFALIAIRQHAPTRRNPSTSLSHTKRTHSAQILSHLQQMPPGITTHKFAVHLRQCLLLLSACPDCRRTELP